MAAVQEAIVCERINRVANAKGRVGAVDVDSPTKYKCGDLCDIWRDPLSKDITGWRGPCEVVNDTKQDKGKLGVEWAGRTLEVP